MLNSTGSNGLLGCVREGEGRREGEGEEERERERARWWGLGEVACA